MFYWLVYEKLCSSIYSPFRVFQYATFRTAMASLTALLLSIAARAVADRAFARISDRPAYSRRRTAIAPEESRHADHGRPADLRLDRDSDAAVGESDACPRCGSRWPGW